jgi:magnesium-transporting ATPase (P-type)
MLVVSIQIIGFIIGDLIVIQLDLPIYFITLIQCIVQAVVIITLIILLYIDKIKIFAGNLLSSHFVKHYLHLANDSFIDAFLIDIATILILEHYVPVEIINGLTLGILYTPILAFGLLIRMNEAKREDVVVVRRRESMHLKSKAIIERWLGYSIFQVIIVPITVYFAYLFLSHLPSQSIELLFEDEEIYKEVLKLLFPLIALLWIRGLSIVNNSLFYAHGALEYLTFQVVLYTLLVFVPTFIVDTIKPIGSDQIVLTLLILATFMATIVSFYQLNLLVHKEARLKKKEEH